MKINKIDNMRVQKSRGVFFEVAEAPQAAATQPQRAGTCSCMSLSLSLNIYIYIYIYINISKYPNIYIEQKHSAVPYSFHNKA